MLATVRERPEVVEADRRQPEQQFALAVGLLAGGIAGAGPLRKPPPEQPPLARGSVEALQRALNLRGFDSGEPDGIAGPATRRAVRD